MKVNHEHRINGYILTIDNVQTIKNGYRGMVLISYRSDIKSFCNPPSVIYTPGVLQSPEAAEIEALAYAQELIWSEALATILDG